MCVDRLRFATTKRPHRRRRLPVVGVVSERALVNAFTVAFAAMLFLYLSTGRSPVLVALMAVAGLGVDQALRTHPREEFRGVTATAIYLFVPVLFAAAVGLAVRDVSSGLWNLVATLVASVIYYAAAQAEYLTVDASPDTYPVARMLLSFVSYLTAFGMFAVVFTSGLPLPAATLIVSATTLLLTVDILRELDVQTWLLFAYAAATAAVIAEARWAMYYVAFPDLVAGGQLLVTFYVASGLIQAYLSGHLDRRTMIEFGSFALAGEAIVVIATTIARAA